MGVLMLSFSPLRRWSFEMTLVLSCFRPPGPKCCIFSAVYHPVLWRSEVMSVYICIFTYLHLCAADPPSLLGLL